MTMKQGRVFSEGHFRSPLFCFLFSAKVVPFVITAVYSGKIV